MSLDLDLVLLNTKAAVLIDTSINGIKNNILPSSFYIDEMSCVASDLIELSCYVEAGRVDKALVDWCGLLLDA